MNILVIEDKELHRTAAQETLAGHDLTIVSTYDEACESFNVQYDEEKVQRLLAEAGWTVKPSGWDQKYYQAEQAAREQSVLPFPYEAVLIDLMMPMSRQTLGPGHYRHGEQVPYGLILALRAAERGAKFVAVVTDTNHHQGAMSAALDQLGGCYYQAGAKPNFVINGAQCLFVHTPFKREFVKDDPCNDCHGSGKCQQCRGTGRRNDEYVQGTCNVCQGSGKCRQCQGVGKWDHEVVTEKKDWGQVLKDLTQDLQS